MYEIVIEHPAEHYIKQQKKEVQTKIFNSISDLSINPAKGHKLKGRLLGFRSLVIGVHRVIYSVEDTHLIIYAVAAGHRENIYSKNIKRH